MIIEQFIELIRNQPEKISFDQVMALIAEHFHYTPGHFTNGQGSNMLINEAGSNEGSCKIFAFARLSGLNVAETLACFGKYYREDVLQRPDGENHANIRNFIRHGWSGIHFDLPVLVMK